MTRNPAQFLFDWKVRGVRWIEIILFAVVAGLVLSVYVAKAAAARESARIAQLEREIAETRQRVRLLRAEAARLERPERLEDLSRGAGLIPVERSRVADGIALSALKPVSEPEPPVPSGQTTQPESQAVPEPASVSEAEG